MGIQNLFPFLKKKGIEKNIIPLSKLKGKIIAIDTQGIIFLYMNAAIKNKYTFKMYKMSGEDRMIFIDYINKCLTSLSKKFESFNIKTIFVFDGKCPIEKTETRRIRKESELKSREKCEKEGTISTRFNEEEVKVIVEYLKKTETVMIDPELEGEKLCCKLCKEKKADYVYSKDGDCLAYGAEVFISKIEGDNVHSIGLKRVLNALNMTYDQFRCLCIFSKCDYNKNIPDVAITKMYKVISNVGTDLDKIKEEIRRTVKKNMTDEEFALVNYERCKELFTI